MAELVKVTAAMYNNMMVMRRYINKPKMKKRIHFIIFQEFVSAQSEAGPAGQSPAEGARPVDRVLVWGEGRSPVQGPEGLTGVEPSGGLLWLLQERQRPWLHWVHPRLQPWWRLPWQRGLQPEGRPEASQGKRGPGIWQRKSSGKI